MRNISFSLTTPQFVAGTKDVTRRLGWEGLKAGDVLRAVEKGMGLKKGEEVKPLALILVVDVRVEQLARIVAEPAYGLDEVRREGFPEMTPAEFVDFFCRSHTGCFPERPVTRIEFKKLPLIRQAFSLHMRLSHGSTIGYDLLAEDGAKIGARSVFTPRGRNANKHPARTIFTLYGEASREFESAADFLVAYQQQLEGAAR